jgi:queuine tRNA-ribosyltransferase
MALDSIKNLLAIKETSSQCEARIGILSLPHGPVETPVFMPVGTQGTIKGLSTQEVEDLGFSLILGNTYHLYLRPGMDVISIHGGLHEFSQWKKNILTDSGGFQVFSLAPFRKITNQGVYFQSHIDGAKHLLTPEKAVEIQCTLNSDIQMVLDVCTEPGISEKEAEQALILTSEWALRAKHRWQESHENYLGHLFAIVQGNFYHQLRTRSAEELVAMDFPGYAIGGLSVGETAETFREFLAYTAPLLPFEKPKYVMGIGTPDYILDAVEQGIDMFDCVFPTRVARNGYLFTRDGKINIRNAKHSLSTQSVDPDSPIHNYSLSYLRHLFVAKEMLGPMLATKHNLWFLHTMMEEIKQSIREDRFLEYKKEFLFRYNLGQK